MIPSILLNGLWQGVAIFSIAALLCRGLRRESASTRCAVWLVALLSLAFVPVITALWPLHLPAFQNSVSSGAPARIRITLVALSTAADRSWIVWPLLVLWQCGVALSLLRLAVSAVRIERIRRNALPTIIGPKAVLVSAEITTPVAAGIFSPVVILPHDLIDRLSHVDIDRIVAHERAHIRRNDILANYVQRCIEAVLWFNPAVYAVGHQLVKEREAACDDAAVQSTGASHDYAACLASLAQSIARPQTPLVSPSVFGSRRALVSRIERLLNESVTRKYRLNGAALAVAVAVFVAMSAAFQAFSPALAASADVPVAATSVAAACAPTEAIVTNPAMPELPADVHPKRPTLLKVSILADGAVSRIDMLQSSGDRKTDGAVAQAASNSTYKPATRNCKAVPGAYIFRVEFASNT
jgi:beta-lactamase regulating signal transducer with metallopeptidase domain